MNCADLDSTYQAELERIHDLIVKLQGDISCTIADCGEEGVEPVRTTGQCVDRLQRILDSFSRKPKSRYTFAHDRGQTGS